MAIHVNASGPSVEAQVSRSGQVARVKDRTCMGFLDSFRKPVKSREVMFFASQLSLMLEIGTPLNVALKSIGQEVENPAFKDVLATMHREIEEGRQLSETLNNHPRIFNQRFISMVKAGESGGFLKKIFDRIVEMQEKSQALIAQVRSSMTYPIVLCVLGILVIVFVLIGVLPKFTAFFEGKESILPLTTRFLMAASDSLRRGWWAYILAVAGLTVGIIMWQKSGKGRALTDRFLISGPMISGLMNKIYTCEMVRTLGNLLESQVPMLEALNVTRPTIQNQYYRHFVDQITKTVDQGGRFSQPFSAHPYIPETVKQMVAIGEEAGKLPAVMLRLAGFYDTEIENDLKKLTALIEPMALIFMGGVVGLIVSSIILPLFKLSQALH